MDTVALILEETSGITRINEPLSVGIPFTKGVLFNANTLSLRDERIQVLPLQTHVMDRWSDQSCRWLLIDFQATVHANTKAAYSLAWGSDTHTVTPSEISVKQMGDTVCVDTGVATFWVDRENYRPFKRVTVGGNEVLEPCSNHTMLTDVHGQQWTAVVRKISTEAGGPCRVTLYLEGSFHHPSEQQSIAIFYSRVHFFAGHSVAKVEFTIRNPRRAEHPGGLWDLGDPGSIYFEDLAMWVNLRGGKSDAIHWTAKPNRGLRTDDGPHLEIYQDSSGGEHWQSRNHVNRFGSVMNSFRGYKVRASGTTVATGERAQPTLIVSGSGGSIAAAMESFWQNFPKSIEVDGTRLALRLFPTQHADVFELQAGEQKTHTVYLHFSSGPAHENPIAWVHQPLRPQVDAQWYARSEVFPFMVAEVDDPNREYLDLVHCAIDGDLSFFNRREIVDEYGWRHFGDLYADHEQVYYSGPNPLISHYNNQYDAIYAFTLHYARSGDPRWFQLMRDLACHVIDIDIYHTLDDKAAYSGGLFWHTDHYTDAATSTHRTYSRQAVEDRALKDYGGGPCNEHLYTTGLMTYYFLTGAIQAREAVIGLADWVIRMDDGNLTPLRFFSRGATGLASQTGSRDYHGPGRGAANCINALLDAYRLSRNCEYLNKAEELIRRCIHPADAIGALNLVDPERRWSYLAFLQALGKYLDCKVEWQQIDDLFHYARESLLHYARWMIQHEVPYSQVMDRVEYPTETWVVQDLRKSNILDWAALYSDNNKEREAFHQKADFFYKNCFNDLRSYATKTCTRPLVLLLHYGSMHSYFQIRDILPRDNWQHFPAEFRRPKVFKSQRHLVESRLKLVSGISGAVIIGVFFLLMVLF
jgi:hypothetical protein